MCRDIDAHTLAATLVFVVSGALSGLLIDEYGGAAGALEWVLRTLVVIPAAVYRVHEVPGIDGDRFLRDAWALARPYWSSEDRWRARGLLAAVALVYLFPQIATWLPAQMRS